MDWADADVEDKDTPKARPDAAPERRKLGLTKKGESKEPGAMPANSNTLDKKTGIRTIVEWSSNDEGKKVKRTMKVAMRKKEVRVKKTVIARRKWVKYGVCSGQSDGPEDGITRQEGLSTIEVTLKTKEEEKESVMEAALKAKIQATASKTKYKFQPKGLSNTTGDDFWDAARKKYFGEDTPEGDVGGEGLASLKMTHQREGGSGYVPPALRAGAGSKMTEGSRFGRRDETATVRITNLSDEAVEADLQDLCRPFGPIQRIYLAKDKHTFQSKGFAFINYHRREDAIKAIEKLNGYGYDNLILRVEWAKPSGEGPGGGAGGPGGGGAPPGGRSYSDRGNL